MGSGFANPWLVAPALVLLGFLAAASAAPRAGRSFPWLIFLTLVAMPWLCHPQATGARALVAMSCVAMLLPKLIDAHVAPSHWHGRPWREWLAFLPALCVLVHRLPGPADSPVMRARGRRMIARAIVQMAIGAVLLAWAMRANLGAISFWLDHGVKLVAIYLLAFDGTFILLGGVMRACGVAVVDQTRDPVLATTPADFWRRYNREAGRWFYEDVFKPVGGFRHPRRAIVATFLLNGLLHEYLAWILVGHIQGFQMTFFILHGLATALTFRVRPRTRAAKLVGILLTLTFLYFTSVLFFASVAQIVPWYSG